MKHCRAAIWLLVLSAPVLADTDADLRREAEKRAAAARQVENKRARSNALWRSRLDPRLDEDRDGVRNADDWCLRTRPRHDGSFNVDAYGCAPYQRDGDGDGVMDAYDRCPNTAGRGPYGQHTLVDPYGCEIWVWRDGTYTSERILIQPEYLINLVKSLLAQTDNKVIEGVDAATPPAADVPQASDKQPAADVTQATDATPAVEATSEENPRPFRNKYVATAFVIVDWIMYPPDQDRSLRTSFLCAAAAGLVGLLAAFVTNRVQKKPIEETYDKRYTRRKLPIAKRR